MKNLRYMVLVLLGLTMMLKIQSMEQPLQDFSSYSVEQLKAVDLNSLSAAAKRDYNLRVAELNADFSAVIIASAPSSQNGSKISVRRNSSASALSPDMVDPADALAVKRVNSGKVASAPVSPLRRSLDATPSPSSGSSSSGSPCSSEDSSATDMPGLEVIVPAEIEEIARPDYLPKTHSTSGEPSSTLTNIIEVAGVGLVAWAAIEAVVAYKNISQCEWNKHKGLQQKLLLIAKKTGNAMYSRPSQGIACARDFINGKSAGDGRCK